MTICAAPAPGPPVGTCTALTRTYARAAEEGTPMLGIECAGGVRGDDRPRPGPRLLRRGARAGAGGGGPFACVFDAHGTPAAGHARGRAPARALHGARMGRRRHRRHGAGPGGGGRALRAFRRDGPGRPRGVGVTRAGRGWRGSATPTATSVGASCPERAGRRQVRPGRTPVGRVSGGAS